MTVTMTMTMTKNKIQNRSFTVKHLTTFFMSKYLMRGLQKYEKRILGNLKTSKDEEEIFRIRKIVENVKRVAEYASDIGEIVLNMNIEKILKKSKM